MHGRFVRGKINPQRLEVGDWVELVDVDEPMRGHIERIDKSRTTDHGSIEYNVRGQWRNSLALRKLSNAEINWRLDASVKRYMQAITRDELDAIQCDHQWRIAVVGPYELNPYTGHHGSVCEKCGVLKTQNGAWKPRDHQKL